MATEAGKIVVRLTAETSKFQAGIKKAQTRLKKFGSATKSFFANNKLLIAASGAAIVAGIAKSVKAFGVQEKAIAQLNQSLKNQGALTEEVSQDLQDYASSLQKVTTFGDEAIIGLQSQLVNFGLLGDELKEATQVTLDMATATGQDLKAAALLVGKAFVGETGSLSRYGIILDKGLKKSEKFTNALLKMNQMFGGQAITVRQTTLGQLEALNNSFGDLQETIGSLVAGEGNSLTIMLTAWIESFNESLILIRDTVKEFGSFGEVLKATMLEVLRAVIDNLTVFIERLSVLGPILKLIGVDIEKVRQNLNAQIDSWQATGQAAAIAGAEGEKAEKKKRIAVKKTNVVIIDEEIKKDETLSLFEDERLQKGIADARKRTQLNEFIRDNFQVTTKEWTDFAVSAANNVFDQFGQGTADMILEGKSFSDVIKKIWKDLARVVIAQIAKMIAKWLAFQALKAATGGFAGFLGGAAHGGIITEPSIITGLRSGTTLLAGEAGPEAIVPLNRPSNAIRNQTADEIGGFKTPEEKSGKQEEITINFNISGQFIEADENKWQRLIREVIVPEIRRFSMSVPVGPFNRRRGF